MISSSTSAYFYVDLIICICVTNHVILQTTTFILSKLFCNFVTSLQLMKKIKILLIILYLGFFKTMFYVYFFGFSNPFSTSLPLPDPLFPSLDSSSPRLDPASLGVGEPPPTKASPRSRLSRHENAPNSASQSRVSHETRESLVLRLARPSCHIPRTFNSSSSTRRCL